MMHPDSELRFIHPSIGFGVVATKPIPRGTITWVRDSIDRIITPAELANLPESMQIDINYWGFINGNGDTIFCRDHGRFVNHSCAPNCSGLGFDFELAIRNIEPGEELTDDYGRLRAKAEFECLCGSPRCRKVIHSDGRDLARYGETWAAEARAALASAPKVPQALWGLLSAEERHAIGREERGTTTW